MARDLGTAELGLGSETGFPAIDGVDPTLLSFPGFAPAEALRVAPGSASGQPIGTWALGLDVYIPQPAGTFVSLLQTGDGDGDLFLRDNGDGTAGIGVNGVYDGAFAFDAWNRIIATVSQESGDTVLRKYLNGALVGTQNLGATDRWEIDPQVGVRLFNDNDGETAGGAVSSVFFTTDVPSAAETAGVVASIPAPDAAGFFPAAPSDNALEIGFGGEDVAPRYGEAQVFLDGFGFRTPNVLNDSAIALASQFGIDGPGGADVAVLDHAAYGPAEGVLVGVPPVVGDLSSYTAIWDVRFDALDGFQALLQTDPSQSGDGDLFVRGDGGIGIGGDYDGAVSAGTWARIAVTVEDQGDGSSTLTKYLDGALLDAQSVDAARFTLNAATGFLLMSDDGGETGEGHLAHFALSEEVLDAAAIAALGGADGDGPLEATAAAAPQPLPPTGAGTRTLTLTFDSSFRPYDDMTGEVAVSVDGAGFQSLLTLDTAAVPGGTSALDRVNETVSLDFEVDEAATEVAFSFNLRDGGNDWWWAVDNLALTDESGALIYAENFDGLAEDLRPAADENVPAIGWTDTPPDGWTRQNDPAMPQGTTEWQGWSFATPEFWTAADGQNRGDFDKGTGVVAIADPDEWDDFNTGSLTGSDFDSTITTPIIALELPATPTTYQLGFDGYEAGSEFGFQRVEVIDEAPVVARQDNIQDQLLRAGEGPAVFDLLEAFGAEATGFEASTTDGDVVAAEIDGTTLTLTQGELGHADIVVVATGPDGEPLTERFRAISAGENAYVFAVIPDTQDYTSNQTLEDNSFSRMTDWLVDQKDSLAIQHVIHVGDVVQFGAESQWEIAEDAMERLDGELSYSLAVGNHDQQRPGFSSAFSFETDIDAYFTAEQVGATPAQGGGVYDGFDVGPDTFGNGSTYSDSIRNAYSTLETPDGTKWLVFSLEFGMPDDVLRWAGEVIEAHLDHRVIINTHSWNGGDGRVTPTTEPLNTDNDGWGYAIRENPRGVNGGEDAWREFASKYPNVAFTFNGHNFMGGAETVVSYGAGDNAVHQMFVNYQNGAWRGVEGVGTNGGNGALRLVVIDPENERFTTHTKLVETDEFFADFPDHEETFENVDLSTPAQIALAEAGPTRVVAGDGIAASTTLDPSATLGDVAGATFEWFAADGEKLGETDGAPLEVDLQTGTNRLVLKVTDANGAVSTDETVVIVEAPEALLTETFDDGEADGWAEPGTGVGDVRIGTDLGFALPSLGNVGQIPISLDFASSFRPYDAMTGEVLVSFDDGATFSTLLTLDASTAGGNSSLDRANEAVSLTALAPNSADTIQFAWRMSDMDNDWWWAIDDIEVAAEAVVREALLSEDFEGLALGPFVSVSESGGDGTDWTDAPPAGWSRDNGATPAGTPEFDGWTFLDKDAWIATAGDQSRSAFARGQGTVAVADGDEYEDLLGAVPNAKNVLLETPEIDLTGYDAGSVRLTFDSSFRPYADQTGTVEVSFDGGGSFSTLLTLDTSTVPGGASSLDRANEAVSLDLHAGAEDSVIVRWRYADADNDWWWAIDNVEVSAERSVVTPLLQEDFDALPLGPVVDETFDPTAEVWTPTPPDGWTQDTAPSMPQGTTEWQGWTFADKEFWIAVAGDQARSTFELGAGTVAVADGDEWDDFNEGSVTGDDFDSTLTTPLIDLTGVGGGQTVGGAAGVVEVPALPAEAGILVNPTAATGEITDYTLIFDLYVQSTTQTFSALYQSDVSNGGDAEAYLRNNADGTFGLGINGDYDGAIAYDAWTRLALTFETDGDGVQTLAKYADGVLLDTQVVDADVSDGSRWTLDGDAGVLLFTDGAGFSSDLYANALHFVEGALSETEIAALGGADADGPIEAAAAGPDAVQLSFDGALDAVDYGAATVELAQLGEAGLGSYLVKGSIFGNPDGEGEAALYQQSNGAEEILVWQGEGAGDWSDYAFDMVVEPADNDVIGAVFYWQDAQTHYRLTMDQQNDLRELVRVEGGVETVLASETASYRHFAMQDLRIAVLGGEITVTLDDELLFGAPVVDPAPLPGGTVGVYAGAMDRALFDNVSVNPITLAARALTVEADGRWAEDLDGDGVAAVEVTAAASLSAEGIELYEWLIDGEVAAQGAEATLELAPGKTQVVLRVTDANGDVSEDLLTLSVAAQAEVRLADDFADGDFDGWTVVDEGDQNGPSDWQVVGGAFVQASDIQSAQQGLGSNAFSVEGDGPFILRDGTYALWDDPAALGWTDYALSATLTPGDDDGIGLLVRYVDADNHYKLESDAQTGLVMLTRHLDGRESILARGWAEYTPGEAQDWRVEVEGGAIRAFIDGKAVFGTPVEDRNLEAGTVGLYAWGSEDLAFDDVSVVALAGEAPEDLVHLEFDFLGRVGKRQVVEAQLHDGAADGADTDGPALRERLDAEALNAGKNLGGDDRVDLVDVAAYAWRTADGLGDEIELVGRKAAIAARRGKDLGEDALVPMQGEAGDAARLGDDTAFGAGFTVQANGVGRRGGYGTWESRRLGGETLDDNELMLFELGEAFAFEAQGVGFSVDVVRLRGIGRDAASRANKAADQADVTVDFWARGPGDALVHLSAVDLVMQDGVYASVRDVTGFDAVSFRATEGGADDHFVLESVEIEGA